MKRVDVDRRRKDRGEVLDVLEEFQEYCRSHQNIEYFTFSRSLVTV